MYGSDRSQILHETELHFSHATFPIISEALLDLFLIVHDKRAIGVHGFVERLPSEEKELTALF